MRVRWFKRLESCACGAAFLSSLSLGLCVCMGYVHRVSYAVKEGMCIVQYIRCAREVR